MAKVFAKTILLFVLALFVIGWILCLLYSDGTTKAAYTALMAIAIITNYKSWIRILFS